MNKNGFSVVPDKFHKMFTKKTETNMGLTGIVGLQAWRISVIIAKVCEAYAPLYFFMDRFRREDGL